MKLDIKMAAMAAILVLAPSFALAHDGGKACSNATLRGKYVVTASGFTRPPASTPGTPWVPKAIVEVLVFNGDGTLTTPYVAVANPFGDTGGLVNPPAGGAPGTYTINEDCTGTIQFLDAASVTFKIVVDPPRGDRFWFIQSNPANNVFQGSATRVSR
jgi:hypothetical protein